MEQALLVKTRIGAALIKTAPSLRNLEIDVDAKSVTAQSDDGDAPTLCKAIDSIDWDAATIESEHDPIAQQIKALSDSDLRAVMEHTLTVLLSERPDVAELVLAKSGVDLPALKPVDVLPVKGGQPSIEKS